MARDKTMPGDSNHMDNHMAEHNPMIVLFRL